jgi:hypothetical protein
VHELPAVPPSRRGVFTVAEAVAAGWTLPALKHGVRGGRIVRLDRSVYAPAISGGGPEAMRQRFAQASVAAVLVCRPAAATHRSAAVLAELPLWTTPSRACVTVPPRYTGDARVAHLHRATLRLSDLLPGDIPRSRSARTILDVARECGLEEAVVIGDAALHRSMTDLERINAVLLGCQNWPGFRRAAAVLPLLDGRAESPLESASRIRLIRSGVPAPEPQTEILDLAGYRIGFVDLYWDEYGVVGEIDGKDKYPRADPFQAWWAEKRRHDRLREVDIPVVRWGRADLGNLPHLVWRLGQAFAEGARRAGPRRWVARSADRFVPRREAG